VGQVHPQQLQQSSELGHAEVAPRVILEELQQAFDHD
jgi:hypothetical protein